MARSNSNRGGTQPQPGPQKPEVIQGISGAHVGEMLARVIPSDVDIETDHPASESSAFLPSGL